MQSQFRAIPGPLLVHRQEHLAGVLIERENIDDGGVCHAGRCSPLRVLVFMIMPVIAAAIVVVVVHLRLNVQQLAASASRMGPHWN